MSSGISSTNLPTSSAPVEVLGHDEVGGRRRSVRTPIDALARLVAAGSADVTAPTKAALDALLNYPANTGAKVVADPDVAKRGIYIKSGAVGTGAWTRVADLALDPAGAPGYATQAQLNADLAWPNGTVKQVIDDPGPSTATTGNGTYVKVGAVGAGRWDKKSDATVPGLDARTRRMSERLHLGLLGVIRAAGPDGLFRRVFALLSDGVEIAGYSLRRRSDISGTLVRWRARGPDGRRRTLGGILADGGWLVGRHILRPRTGYLAADMVLRDRFGRQVLRVRPDGRVLAKLCDTDGVPYARSDGSAGEEAVPLTRALDAYGVPLGETYRPDWLRNAHHRLACLREFGGVLDGGNCQYSILLQGDSWTTTPLYYVRYLADALAARYGDAGPGWCGFGFSGSGSIAGAARAVLTVEKSGGWISDYGFAPMPGHSLVRSQGAGDRYALTYTKPGGGPNIAAVKIFAIAGGSARYRINGGAWVGWDLSGSGFRLLDCGAIPAGSFTLEIESLSAGVQLGGADYRTTVKGVRVHKGGASGTRSSGWAGADAAIYTAALAELAPHTISVLSGTNSQRVMQPDAERGYLQTLVDRWRAALPTADCLIVSAAENARPDNARPMALYQAAHRRLAFDNGLSHLNLQDAFGPDPAAYAPGSARPLLTEDLIHPSETSGGMLVANRIARLLESC